MACSVQCRTFISKGVQNFFFLRVSGGSDKIHKVLKPFSVVGVRGPQVFQAVRRAKDVTVKDYMIGRLLLGATDAFGCILDAPAVQACIKAADASS